MPDANWTWWFMQLRRTLFFRAAIISALSVFTAFAAFFAKYLIPDEIALRFGADAVDSVLTIIASSMLAVTTFSLSTVVAAHASAASMATPRATALLLSDTTAQTMLSTFVGAFVYSLVGIILLKTGIYGPSGRFVLFAVTIGVVALLVVTLLRWIDFLLRFGRLGETIGRVEKAAMEAVEGRRKLPYLGGAPLSAREPPHGATLVAAADAGYVQHIEMAGLQDCAEKAEARIGLLVQPGTRVHEGRPLAFVEGGEPDEELSRRIRGSFALGPDRSFYQDPRFGVIVLGEIVSRALSPGINDPGTAISVIGRAADVIARWAEPVEPSPDVRYPRVLAPGVKPQELFEGFFHPVARDGAGVAEVQIRLQKALASLARAGKRHGRRDYAELAAEHSRHALDRAERTLGESVDLERVRSAAAVAQQEAG